MRAYVRRVSQKITKLTDEQLEQFFKAINDENEMFYSVIDSLATGILLVDENFKLILTNKAAERLMPFSVRSDDSKFTSSALWQIIDDEPIMQFLKSCAENKLTNVSSEFTTTTAGGSVRFITVSLLPFVRGEKLVGAIVTVHDVTESRNHEILLRRMENMASLTNIAANMAHEIKNPLGAISIHIQLIQKAVSAARDGDGKLPQKKFLENYLDVVNEEIDNLNKSVMDFLMAVRPVHAELMLVNIADVLKSVVEFIEPELNKSGIMVNLNLCKKSVRLLIDEKLFREVIVNIAQNALFAIAEKFPECDIKSVRQDTVACEGRLDFTTFLKNDKYIITIEDNGTGMSDDVAARIFEPYFTTKASGTGLGMTMVYKIVKEFAGDITVKSTLGVGTIFTITIPVPQTDRKLIRDNTDTSSRKLLTHDSALQLGVGNDDGDSDKIADKMAAI